jgi:hypothetical protein
MNIDVKSIYCWWYLGMTRRCVLTSPSMNLYCYVHVDVYVLYISPAWNDNSIEHLLCSVDRFGELTVNRRGNHIRKRTLTKCMPKTRNTKRAQPNWRGLGFCYDAQHDLLQPIYLHNVPFRSRDLLQLLRSSVPPDATKIYEQPNSPVVYLIAIFY